MTIGIDSKMEENFFENLEDMEEERIEIEDVKEAAFRPSLIPVKFSPDPTLAIFTLYTIRRKSDHAYLPMRFRSNRGFSYDEPIVGCIPRVFPTKRGAQLALTKWLQGEWRAENVEQGLDGEWIGGDVYPVRVDGRYKEEMEIVPFVLSEIRL